MLETKFVLTRKILAAIFILVISFLGNQSVFAQEETPAFPSYIIQPGDTLSSIGVRFNVNLSDVVAENNISDPNQLFQGTEIVLPGIDWVSGRLDVKPIPLGESFSSILRRYQVDKKVLGRLSSIVSPTQVYVGFPALLPYDQDENIAFGRAAVGNETSLFELAILSNKNQWDIVGANQLESPWGTISGDVLFIPGTNDPGPGALPSPISQLEIIKGFFVQGKTTVLQVNANNQKINLGGEILGNAIQFFEQENGNYLALQGIHVMTSPSAYPIQIEGELEDGSTFKYSQMVGVARGGYNSETIGNVDASLLSEEVTKPELDFIKNITSTYSSEKLWAGFFQAPSPYSDVINSFFGTRRSFNGSPFDYFHSGVDFGGGLGTEITSPAAGVVAFSGPLDIRGNGTIIDHGWGVYSGYWHQSEIFVQEGDLVNPGQVIGIVGNTGRSSGAHLHWELWVGGVQVEPLDWLSQIYP